MNTLQKLDNFMILSMRLCLELGFSANSLIDFKNGCNFLLLLNACHDILPVDIVIKRNTYPQCDWILINELKIPQVTYRGQNLPHLLLQLICDNIDKLTMEMKSYLIKQPWVFTKLT